MSSGNTPIKAVIFDWGGVIAPNPRGGWVNVLADMLHEPVEALLPHWKAAGYHELSNGTLEEVTFWERLEASYGKPLPSNKTDVWIDGTALDPWPESLELVDALKAAGVTVALLSNIVKPAAEHIRKKGLYQAYAPLLLSCEVGISKPNNEIYALALETLSLKPEECIFIDDTEKNLHAAKSLGIHTLLAKDPKQIATDTWGLIQRFTVV